MKTQMRFQKYLMLISLIVAALSIVYALSFCGGSVCQYNKLYVKQGDIERVPGAANLYFVSQHYNDILLGLAIAFVVVIVLNYVAASNKRRNYYITNYITTGITVVYQIVFAILLLVFVSTTFGYFNVIDRVAAEEAYKVRYEDWHYSIYNFILGYLLAGIVILNAVAIGLNLLWKFKLMKGEKALLKQGLIKEVA